MAFLGLGFVLFKTIKLNKNYRLIRNSNSSRKHSLPKNHHDDPKQLTLVWVFRGLFYVYFVQTILHN